MDSKPLLGSSVIIQHSKYILEFNVTEIIVELKQQLMLAGPFILVSLLQYSFLLTSIMFIGHLGELALSGASMATSFASVTGFSFMVTKSFITFYVAINVRINFCKLD